MAFALGVDVGGTKIAVAAVDLLTGEMRHYRRVPAPRQRPADQSLAVMAELARDCFDAARAEGIDIEAVGLGAPECVSLNGILESAHTYDWTNESVAAALGDMGTVIIASDVQAAALAEATLGAGRGRPICLYVSIGTGISHSFAIDGRIHRGATGNAILFGCSPLTRRCAHCGVDDVQVLEQRAAGPGLARRYAEATATSVTAAESVVAAEAAGDSVAESVLMDAGAEVGEAVGHLINILDPHIVVVGGGVGSSIGGGYWRALEAAARRIPWSAAMQSTPIVRAAFGPHSGVVGAALAAGARV